LIPIIDTSIQNSIGSEASTILFLEKNQASSSGVQFEYGNKDDWLVVSIPLKNIGILIPNILKNKKCSKPPTR